MRGTTFWFTISALGNCLQSTYIVSGGLLHSTHSPTHSLLLGRSTHYSVPLIPAKQMGINQLVTKSTHLSHVTSWLFSSRLSLQLQSVLGLKLLCMQWISARALPQPLLYVVAAFLLLCLFWFCVFKVPLEPTWSPVEESTLPPVSKHPDDKFCRLPRWFLLLTMLNIVCIN